jgi:hypothetical protein
VIRKFLIEGPSRKMLRNGLLEFGEAHGWPRNIEEEINEIGGMERSKNLKENGRSRNKLEANREMWSDGVQRRQHGP